MKVKELEHISITEIARKAGLDRRTFYRHFRSKEDVIRYQIQLLSKEYESFVFTQEHPMKARTIAINFFTICKKNKELLTLLYSSRQLPLLLDELNDIFPKYHNKYHGKHKSAKLEYSMSYHVGGFWNLLIRWIEEGMKETPEELAAIIPEFVCEYI